MERLRFAWWNTRLVHKDGAKQQEIACEVVRRLIDEADVVLLALGEVTEAQAEMLRDACHTRPLSLLAGDSVPRGMVLCYRRDILDLHSYERVTTGWRDKELCEYSLSERGYPVNLRYAKEDVRCHDRQALELGLRQLLAHPETGGKLQRLMGTEQAA